MGLTFMYVGMLAAGYLTGYICRKKDKKINWIVTAQMAGVVVLLFIMGARIGADNEILASLGSIGISSVLLTAAAFAGSILFVTLTRKIFGMNREGVRKND